jgi:hypothetical protein
MSIALQPGLAEIVEAIGEDAAAKLVERFGGGRLYVASGIEGHAIADAIGLDAARKLSGEFRAMSLYIPTTFGHRSKKAAIAAAEGHPRDIARRFGVSIRWVQKVKRGR